MVLNEDRILIKNLLHQKIYGAGTLPKEFSAKTWKKIVPNHFFK